MNSTWKSSGKKKQLWHNRLSEFCSYLTRNAAISSNSLTAGIVFEGKSGKNLEKR